MKGIRKYPYPTLVEIIETVCNSEFDDEITGACRLLLENEWQGIEFREQLLDEIEKRQLNTDRKRYELIYEAAKLDNKTNMRDPLNKKMEEVNADHKYYLRLVDKALKLKT